MTASKTDPLAADVIVIGGGVSGSACALAAARAGANVTLLTRLPDIGETNTRYAQGGIIYTAADDSPEALAADILAAGAHAGDPAAAMLLAEAGPALVRALLIDELGVPFDTDDEGFEGLHLTREAAHSMARIIHHRDTTGSAIQDALSKAIEDEPRIDVRSATRASSLRLDAAGHCIGARAWHAGAALNILAPATVLATGGLGALYSHTTNPAGANGDGLAMAMAAGAAMRDLHYVQFHPTALYTTGGRFLISEALRGEGGVLRDGNGHEFMDHPLGSLAPRDIVARAISQMMAATGAPCAYLDISHRSGDWIAARFPAIHARCQAEGIDPATDPIPVVPAAHYSCGGVAVDGYGRSSVAGLWAIGEVSGTGLHGANRLASTSLLEGLVWGWRAGLDCARQSVASNADLTTAATAPGLDVDAPPACEATWQQLRETMWAHAGLARTAAGLRRGLGEIDALIDAHGHTDIAAPLAVARAILAAALADPTSRGCHYRSDSNP